MKKLLLICGALSLIAGVPVAQAAVSTYNVTTTWGEPMTPPKDSVFIGSFKYDPDAPSGTSKVSGLTGSLSESMTGNDASDMNWLTLGNQLPSWHDDTLQGTFAATFLQNNSSVFFGGGWSPSAGVSVGGITSGTGNAYALIFVPDTLTPGNNASNPLTLTWDEAAGTGSRGLASTAYADCQPGGIMSATQCMTATSALIYGALGTMDGYPASQIITLAPVPEPESYAMLLAGLGLLGFIGRRRRQAVQ